MLHLDRIEMGQGDFTLSADWALEGPRRVAVIGPSGAGKSTLLDGIAGFSTPRRGTVRLRGRDVTGMPPAERGVSILFQDNNLFPHLTLAQTLTLALRPRGGRLSGAEADRLQDALAQVDLAGMGGRRPSELSGGQISRAALARVLVQDHPVLLLDEPFAALGPGLRAELLDRVSDLAARTQKLCLMVTHDPHDAARFAQDVVLVAGGQAAPPTLCEAFFANPPAAFVAYVGQA